MKKTFLLDEVDCPNCAAKAEAAVAKGEGVVSASLNFMAQKLFVEYKDEYEDRIVDIVKSILKKVEPDVEVTVA